jgi:hypothetical protein
VASAVPGPGAAPALGAPPDSGGSGMAFNEKIGVQHVFTKKSEDHWGDKGKSARARFLLVSTQI